MARFQFAIRDSRRIIHKPSQAKKPVACMNTNAISAALSCAFT